MLSFDVQKLSKDTAGDIKAQCAEIAALARVIWTEHYTPIIGAEQVEYMLCNFQSAEQIYTDITRNEFTYFTANAAGKSELIGYCAVAPKDDCLFFSKCYVRSDCRGNGIARAFLNESAALCRTKYGPGRIRLTVNKYNSDSIAVYKKLGFKIADSVKTDIGGGFFMDDYIMELRL